MFDQMLARIIYVCMLPYAMYDMLCHAMRCDVMLSHLFSSLIHGRLRRYMIGKEFFVMCIHTYMDLSILV